MTRRDELRAAQPRAWACGVETANVAVQGVLAGQLGAGLDLDDEDAVERFVESRLPVCIRLALEHYAASGDEPADRLGDEVVEAVAVAARSTLTSGMHALAARPASWQEVRAASATWGLALALEPVARHAIALVVGALTFGVVLGLLYLPFGAHRLVWITASAAGLGAFVGLRRKRGKPARDGEPPDWPVDLSESRREPADWG